MVVVAGAGCSSTVGRAGGRQTVTLGPGCLHTGQCTAESLLLLLRDSTSTRRRYLDVWMYCLPGIVLHELMHTAGFWHEQSRQDRDQHVTINWDNIRSHGNSSNSNNSSIFRAGMEVNFLKYDLSKIDHLGAPYDTCSVMHYGPAAFAKVAAPNNQIFQIFFILDVQCA